MTDTPHCLSDYWQIEHNREKFLGNIELPERILNSVFPKRTGRCLRNTYGKTQRPQGPKYKRVKKGNRAIFHSGDKVKVDSRRGMICDRYEHDGVFFYQISWDMFTCHLSWYDKHIGNTKKAGYSWSEARFIKLIEKTKFPDRPGRSFS